MAGSDSTAVIVWVTAPAEVSAGLASAIIEKRIAACVQVVPGISSYFWWDNQVQQEGEHLLLIKTMRSSVAALKSLVTALHPYEVPELLVTAVQDGLDPYLAWIQETIAR
ncbi:divalent-cation tolerance protein CutA [Spirochaeta africana]|uniref:divalent-cation tolerance protein CutA n=1 Tax=Spirochaeta africana TaxID=46355 RepID=UPI0002E9A058|nr:divalent-cation tolerance protein CutA [Spirochaeta africana]